LPAKVDKVAEKGRDEFEEYDQATRNLTGKENRQVFDVEVEVQDGAAGLRPGQRVEVEVEVCRLPDAWVVPRSAVHREGTADAWVFVAQGRAAERKPVKILAEDELWCAIEGLQEGQQVWRVRP
jgi:multidrug efflux pump subunit AcrA (membrane-fusion protein)